MLNFKQFISEDILSEAALLEAALSSSVASDDKGKLHELLLAKHMHPEKKLPQHHRAESDNPDYSGTPEQVHNKLRKKVGEEAYNEIDSHAEKTAKALHHHLQKNGHIPKGGHIADVHWTSNRDTPSSKGDHEKTTGKKDVNSNADLILTVHNKSGEHHSYHGVSAKYGTNKKPNFKNSGVDSLERTAGLEKGSLSKHIAAHNKRMEKLGYKGTQAERHKQHKQDLAAAKNGDKEAAARVAAAEKSSRETRTTIAKNFAKGLSKKSDSELREHIRNFVAAPTTHTHTVAHTHVHDNGSSTPIIHDAHHIADEHLSNYENLHVKHSGITATIYGTHKKTKKIVPVARHTIKAGSGPHKGVAGTFTL